MRTNKIRGSVFLTDDNITHDIPHFRRVCQAIIGNGLNDMLYAVQVSAAGIANNPDLVKDMACANFRLAFVGFESMLPSALKNMNKPTTQDINRRAAKLLKENQIGIVAGIIAGYPDDTAETIRQSFDHFLALNPGMIYAQYLTPYPKTVLRNEMLKDGLVANVDDFTKYDGFTCNTRTRHLAQSELYRCLKRQALRAYSTPSLIFRHFEKL
jgi:anaerobic magnesium-protoporphyrin IX monomethyl ester cyclase